MCIFLGNFIALTSSQIAPVTPHCSPHSNPKVKNHWSAHTIIYFNLVNSWKWEYCNGETNLWASDLPNTRLIYTTVLVIALSKMSFDCLTINKILLELCSEYSSLQRTHDWVEPSEVAPPFLTDGLWPFSLKASCITLICSKTLYSRGKDKRS